LRVGPTNGKVYWHHEFALADHHEEQNAIDTGTHPVFLPTPPSAYKPQLPAILFEHRVIADPGPLQRLRVASLLLAA
jgi:hypothetical protein